MIPIGDDNSGRRIIPAATYALLALNLAVFFLQLTGSEAFTLRWAFTPAAFLADPIGQGVTVFTAMFMHGGWFHLLSNMLYLWIFGDNVEDRMGHSRFLLFYLLCGVIGTFAQFVIAPNSPIPNLGASGAISGVLGAYIYLFPRGRVARAGGVLLHDAAGADRDRLVDYLAAV